MFVKITSGEVFHVLIQGPTGDWMISYDKPEAPFFVTEEELKAYERVEAPDDYVAQMTVHRTAAAEKRYQLILPLISDMQCILDARHRNTIVRKIAEENQLSIYRIRSLYFKYLATGRLLAKRNKGYHQRPEYDQAIRKYYFSAKQNSLRTSYELMLLEFYTDKNGVLNDDIPTFLSFSKYYERHWSKNPQREISREGIGHYKRNSRPLFGSAMAYRTKIGSYCIDETPADLHVVSNLDRTKAVGRPIVYLAVDTASQMIAGVHIGMDSGEKALLSCIANAAMDKVTFCESLGIKIMAEDWPCVGMPSEIISDRGQEFCGERMNEVCMHYGVDLNSNEPFRPDLKSLVERNMGLIQDSYRSMLEGSGVIGSDAAERWAVDYRKQAILTLEEYKTIVVHCILAINHRVLENVGHLPSGAPNTPVGLWAWMLQNGDCTILPADLRDIYLRSLPRAKAKVERKGIFYKKLRYVPEKKYLLPIGHSVEFAYDTENSSYIYLVDEDKNFIPFRLAESSMRYDNLGADEIAALQEEERTAKGNNVRIETEMKVKLRKNIQDIIVNARNERDKYL